MDSPEPGRTETLFARMMVGEIRPSFTMVMGTSQFPKSPQKLPRALALLVSLAFLSNKRLIQAVSGDKR
jgi:hypothetical protein